MFVEQFEHVTKKINKHDKLNSEKRVFENECKSIKRDAHQTK